jgi:hypothetical protein
VKSKLLEKEKLVENIHRMSVIEAKERLASDVRDALLQSVQCACH